MLFFSFFSLLSCHFSQLLYTHYSLAYSSRVPQYYNNFKDFPYGLPKTTQHLTFTYQQPSKTYIQQNKVAVFICDLNIDNVDGFVLIEELKEQLIDAKIIILTVYYENFLIRKTEFLVGTPKNDIFLNILLFISIILIFSSLC
jgi:hypothetical protein